MSAAPPSIIDTKGLTNPTVTAHGVTAPARADSEYSSASDEENLSSKDAKNFVSVNTSAATSEDELLKQWVYSTLTSLDFADFRFYEPPDTWESKHRWDPTATWTPEEEKKILKKIDLRVALAACVFFSCLCLDRSNINNALSDNMLGDLGLTTYHYNIGQTIFYCAFLFAELPSQMSKSTPTHSLSRLTLVSKKLGSDVWIPIQMMAWSTVAITQCALTSLPGFYITRALIGLIEGGFIADTILYLSYYYTANELTIRLSYFYASLTITNIYGAFLAAGILQLRHVSNTAGWRWLFAIEGAITFLIGLFAFFWMPPGPTQTKTRWRRKPWFTEREEIIIVNKVIRDDPTKSDMHNREGLSFKQLWLSLTDYDLWPVYLLGILWLIAPSTVGAYFSLTLRSLGFNTFQTNLLTIPSQIGTIITNLGLAYSSRKLKERFLIASLSQVWLLVCFIALVLVPDTINKWAKWALLTVIIAYPYPHPILVSSMSMNAGSVRTRTVASSVYNMFVQASSLIASNIYQPSDAPHYHKGNRILLGLIAASLLMFWFAKAWLVFRNKQKAKIWNSFTKAQKEEYLRTTTDQGNKRLDFVFQH